MVAPSHTCAMTRCLGVLLSRKNLPRVSNLLPQSVTSNVSEGFIKHMIHLYFFCQKYSPEPLTKEKYRYFVTNKIIYV